MFAHSYSRATTNVLLWDNVIRPAKQFSFEMAVERGC